jgi:hypothetical protein
MGKIPQRLVDDAWLERCRIARIRECIFDTIDNRPSASDRTGLELRLSRW